MDTKRNGKTRRGQITLQGELDALQRFLCKGCNKTFTFTRKRASKGSRFATDVIEEAVRIYVQGLASYRVLSTMLEQRIGCRISPKTLNEWVHEVGQRAKTPLEVSIELAPSWGGFLGVDGKAIWIAGLEHAVYLGVDYPTNDIVHALLLTHENAAAYARLVTEARLRAGHPLLGVVSDLGKGGSRSVSSIHRDHFGAVPLQFCRVHFDRRLDMNIPIAKRSKRRQLHAELKDRIRSILYAPTYEQACSLSYALSDDRFRYAGVGRYDMLASLEQDFGAYMTHHFVPGMPADNNFTENVIKQLGKKLRLMEGFGNLESADSFLRLLVGCYRFKRLTSCQSSARNGKSPLELAEVTLPHRDWLRYLLDR